MLAFYSLVLGSLACLAATLLLGTWMRRRPDIKNARIAARISHFFVIAGLVIPNWGFSIPWLEAFDAEFGIPPLPLKTFCWAIGVLMLPAGLGLMLIAMFVLVDSGRGMAAFQLTKTVAAEHIYRRTRNPMALGFSLTCVALGLTSGSTAFTLWSIAAVIPTLMFYLKFFEERELEIRFGHSYTEYKNGVPFLIPRFSIGATCTKSAGTHGHCDGLKSEG